MSDEETKTEADKVINTGLSDDGIDGPVDDLSNLESNNPIDEPGKTTPERNNEPAQNTVDENDEEEAKPDNTPPDLAPETDSPDQEDIQELTLHEIDLPNDEFDDEDKTTGGKQKWILLSSFIAILAILSSVGVWYFTSDDVSNNKKEVALSIEIPRQSKLKKGRKKMISSSQKLLQKGSPSIPPKRSKKLTRQNKLKPLNKLKSAGNTNKPQTAGTKNNSPNPKKQANRKKNKKAIAKAPQFNSGAKILANGMLVLPSVTSAAFKGIPMMENPRPLADPDKSLSETVGGGVIPKISTDGRRPWKFYGKTFRKDKTLPRVSIIIKGLGLSKAATTAAINHTPSEVTLAFNPYAKGVGNWVGLARAVGHETLIILPMEPIDFPNSDPGPFALQVDLQKTENIDRLRYILSVSRGNIGLLQMMGTRFVASRKALEPILKEIHSRGLLIVDNGFAKNSQISKISATIGLPRARSDIFLDQNASRSAIMQKLSALEATAKKNKSAIGIAQPLPNSISLIMNWARTLAAKKIILAPISAVVKISNTSKIQVNAPATDATKN
jgi:polysaccharide deacetylase 2 family uncharacterized protein YibQ